LQGLERAKQPGLDLFSELVTTCLAQPGLTTGQLLELYRDNKFYQQLETLATWNHMIVEDMVEEEFRATLASLYDSILEQRLEELIAKARTHGLSPEERAEVSSLNQVLAKKN
jgi:DNA primase